MINTIKELMIRGMPEEIDFESVERLFSGTCFADMKTTMQNPVFHGEGDVFTHTKMVCRELLSLQAFQALNERRQTELFTAALLHDIGKVKTTRWEDGAWTSPNHGSVGNKIAREILFRDLGLCGTDDALSFRETVCSLILYHMTPLYILNKDDYIRKLRAIASAGERASDFSLDMLCILSEADIKGRLAANKKQGLKKVELCRMAADEAGCLYEPYRFSDDYTKRAYLSGRNVPPDQPLYDDTWGEVILTSGLPGTGKDTWTEKNHPVLPVVSLDSIRKELKIKPTENQGKVISAARERAREYLRNKTPFIWNSTNLTESMRSRIVETAERYGASVRIVYLETGWEERIRRNNGRRDKVPEEAVGRMLEKTVVPLPYEAGRVEWICI